MHTKVHTTTAGIRLGSALLYSENWDSKVRSTIRPTLWAHCLSFNQLGLFCEAPSCSSTKALMCKMHLPTWSIGTPKCALLSANCRGQLFSLNQAGVFYEAPSCTSHQKLYMSKIYFPTQSVGTPKCALLSAPVQGPTVSVSIK